MNTTETIRQIEKVLGMFETSRVTTFEGVLEREDGSSQEVTVEVFDAGGDEEAERYAVNLRFQDGTGDIFGDSAPTLEEALSDVAANLE